MNPRLGLALALPLLALALQWVMWPWITPFVWFLFFPAVFFSARLGGIWAGLASTALSTVLVWYFFIPPQLSWKLANPSNVTSAILFLAMGYLFSESQERLRRAQRATEATLADTAASSARITEFYRKAQAELQRYEHIVATTGDMLAFVDRDMRFQVANTSYAKFIGSTPTALRLRPVADVVGERNFQGILFSVGKPSVAGVKARLERALAGESQHFTIERPMKDGRRLLLDAEYRPYFHDGVVDGVVVTLRDMTELKASEQALKASEERLQLALDASNDGLWDWDVRNGVVYRSQRYYELTGYQPDEATPDFEFFMRIVHSDDLRQVTQAIDAHRQGKSPAIAFECRLVTRSGAIRWMQVRGRAVERDAGGTPLRMVGTMTDIGERKTAEESLRRQTGELLQRNAELERFNRATVGREFDMITLKQQVNALSRQLGEPAPFALAFLDAPDQPVQGATQ